MYVNSIPAKELPKYFLFIFSVNVFHERASLRRLYLNFFLKEIRNLSEETTNKSFASEISLYIDINFTNYFCLRNKFQLQA